VKEHVYGVNSRTIKDLVARFQAAVIPADAKMLRHVRENSVRGTSVLKWTDAASTTSCINEAPVI
jgi:hypothetical protein